MNSYGTIPTTSHIEASIRTTSPSKQLFDIQFAPEVSVTNNQQFHQLTQQQQAALMHHHHQQQQQQQQQQQERSPPQVMYDNRRNSISSSLGTSSRRGQSKAEKRAEHNAIERARREGLNTRFQQLAHVLPNLHHDTRPSKGTIIERTLDFVKDAIQKEERYQHEIKDLRHTNRQLLKQLTHLTTGQLTNNEAMDSDEEEISSISSPSPVTVLGNTPSLPVSRGSSPSSASSDAFLPRPSQTHEQQKQPQRIRTKQSSQHQPQFSSRQQVTPKLETPNLQGYQQQQRLVHRHHATDTSKTQLSTTQSPSSLHQAASLSLFSPENWQPPTSNTFWQQQSNSSSAASFHLSDFSSLAVNPSSTSLSSGVCEADLFNDTSRTVSTTTTTTSSTTPSSSIVYPPTQSDQYIHIGAAGQEDIDMKPCDINVTLVKQEYQQTFMPSPTIYPAVQGTMRLSSRPSQSLSQYC